MSHNNPQVEHLDPIQRARRRHKWNEYNKPGVQHDEAEWLKENYEGNIEQAQVQRQDLFNDCIDKIQAMGCNDPAFLDALELGRALFASELNPFDIFQIWCGFNDRTRDQAPKHHDHSRLWDIDAVEEDERRARDENEG